MKDKIDRQIESLLKNNSKGLAFERESNSKIKRILLCRLGGIGDVILTLPLAKYLKKIFPNARIEYITSTNVAELLEASCRSIDKTWSYTKVGANKLALEILGDEDEVDYFFNLHGSLRFFLYNLFDIKAKKYFHFKKDRDLHAVVNFAQTFDLNISAHNLEPKTLAISSSKDLLNQYGLKENRYFCFVPGVGKVRAHRAWSVDSWVMLAKKLLVSFVDKEFKVVFLGGEDEEKLSPYFNSFEGRTADLIGKLSLVDSAKIINSSAGLVSGDTGLLHLAGALSKKVIGIFGPTLPERSGPFTSDFDVLRAKDCMCIGDLKKCKKKSGSGMCMESISIDDVIGKLQIGSLQS